MQSSWGRGAILPPSSTASLVPMPKSLCHRLLQRTGIGHCHGPCTFRTRWQRARGWATGSPAQSASTAPLPRTCTVHASWGRRSQVPQTGGGRGSLKQPRCILSRVWNLGVGSRCREGHLPSESLQEGPSLPPSVSGGPWRSLARGGISRVFAPIFTRPSSLCLRVLSSSDEDSSYWTWGPP